MREQLSCIREFLEQHDADAEMLDAIDFAIEENENWCDSDSDEALASMAMQTGRA